MGEAETTEKFRQVHQLRLWLAYWRCPFQEAPYKLQFVPYRGTGPALNDLIDRQIDIMIDQTSNS